jgi:hypothetical protein
LVQLYTKLHKIYYGARQLDHKSRICSKHYIFDHTDFGLWRLIFAFLTPKNIFFLTSCKISDRWIYHTTILILEPKFRYELWGPIFTFLTPRSIYLLDLYEIFDRLIDLILELSCAQPSDQADSKIQKEIVVSIYFFCFKWFSLILNVLKLKNYPKLL